MEFDHATAPKSTAPVATDNQTTPLPKKSEIVADLEQIMAGDGLIYAWLKAGKLEGVKPLGANNKEATRGHISGYVSMGFTVKAVEDHRCYVVFDEGTPQDHVTTAYRYSINRR